MTTTGYGDIVPAAQDEYILTQVFMVVGVILYSYIYTKIHSMIEEMKSINDKYLEKITLLEELKKEH